MKKTFKIFVVALTLVTVTGACSHKKTVSEKKPVEINTEASTEAKNFAGLIGNIHWIKNAKNNLDLEVTLTNHYGFPIHFTADSWKITVSGTAGTLREQNFTGVLAPGASETKIIRFDFLGETSLTGNSVLILSGIYTEDNLHKIMPLEMKFDANPKP